ncbi:MAG: hypothetical protein QXX08_09210 [Candidatus Bathyarchaeia archaeon]
MNEIGGVIHIGFGVMLLMCIILLVIIGIVAPDLFRTILERLKEISDAIFPSIVQNLV